MKIHNVILGPWLVPPLAARGLQILVRGWTGTADLAGGVSVKHETIA